MNSIKLQAVKSINAQLQNDVLTKDIVNAPDTEVSGIRLAVLRDSQAIAAFNTSTLTGNNTRIPTMDIPDDDDTDFVIDALDIARNNVITTTRITDDTEEDTVPNATTTLEHVLASQLILKIEKAIADKLETADAGPAGNKPRTFNTIKEVITSFPEQYHYIVGKWYVFVSNIAEFDIIASMTDAEVALMERRNIEIVPVYGIGPTTMVVAHSHGIGGGFVIRNIEADRLGGSDTFLLLASGSSGSGFDTNYAKKVTLV